MKYELSGKQKKLEFDLFIEAINSGKLQYYSDYGQDFDLDDTIIKQNNSNPYNGEDKFDLIVNNVIKKLDMLGIKYILNKTNNKEKFESGFREYETSHYTYDFLMTNPKFDFKYAHLSHEQRAFCSLEIIFLLMMHNKKVDSKVLSNIFGFEVLYRTWTEIRKNLSDVLHCKIEKNDKGRYKLIKEKYEL